MPLKFRLKGLAETFVEQIKCPCCGHDGGDDGDQGFSSELTKVTFEGIIVVIRCELCSNIYVPDGQRHGVINVHKLRSAVENDSVTTGQPVLLSRADVRLDVERLNATRRDELQ